MNSTQLDGGTLQPKIFEISSETNKNNYTSKIQINRNVDFTHKTNIFLMS